MEYDEHDEPFQLADVACHCDDMNTHTAPTSDVVPGMCLECKRRNKNTHHVRISAADYHQFVAEEAGGAPDIMACISCGEKHKPRDLVRSCTACTSYDRRRMARTPFAQVPLFECVDGDHYNDGTGLPNIEGECKVVFATVCKKCVVMPGDEPVPTTVLYTCGFCERAACRRGMVSRVDANGNTHLLGCIMCLSECVDRLHVVSEDGGRCLECEDPMRTLHMYAKGSQGYCV
jgi:hypothetical protein